MQFEQFFYGVCYYPEAWDPSRHASDIDRIADAGFNFVRMGEGAWSYWEPSENHFQFELFDRVIDLCRQRNIRVILGTPTYACPAWVATNYPEVLRRNEQRLIMAHGSRRNLNYTSAKMLDLSDRLCTALASHYRDEPQVIGWQLDNEFNCHMAVSYAESDTVAFREWCRKRYKTLDELNRRWGTTFWSQTYSAWEQIDLPHPSATYLNPTRLLDESRFISDTVASFARRQACILRQQNERWFITHNGLFDNIDGPKLAAELDFFSHDQYPLFSPVWTSFAQSLIRARGLSFPFGLLEQQAGPGGQMTYLQRTPRRGEMRLWAWQSVIHGANLLSFFRWRTCPFGSEQHWHGLLDADDRDNRRLAEAKTLGSEIQKLPMDFFAADPVRCVGVEKDFDNETNDWRVNTYIGAGRNENRLWLTEAQRCHFPVDEVWPTSDWNGYQLVVIPHHKITDEQYVQKLKQFVIDGGSIVLGAQSGSKTVDNHVVSTPLPGLLAALAGVEVEDWTMLPAEETREAAIGEQIVNLGVFVEKLRVTTAEPLAVWKTNDSLLSGGVAIGVNSVGRGRVFYVGGYCGSAAVEIILGTLAGILDLKTSINASADVECVRRQNEHFSYTCLLNHGSEPQLVSECPAGIDLIRGNQTGGEVLVEPLEVVIVQSFR